MHVGRGLGWRANIGKGAAGGLQEHCTTVGYASSAVEAGLMADAAACLLRRFTMWLG